MDPRRRFSLPISVALATGAIAACAALAGCSSDTVQRGAGAPTSGQFEDFSTAKSAVSWAQKWYGEPQSGNAHDSTAEGFAAATGGTAAQVDAARNYAAFASGDMNQLLVGEVDPASESPKRQAELQEIRTQAQQLLALFNKKGSEGNRLPNNVVLRRGAGTTGIGKLDVGDPSSAVGMRIDFPRFTSTSVGPTAGFNHKPVLYEFDAPKGLPALNLMGVSKFPEEREVLLGPGFSGTVTKARVDKDVPIKVCAKRILNPQPPAPGKNYVAPVTDPNAPGFDQDAQYWDYGIARWRTFAACRTTPMDQWHLRVVLKSGEVPTSMPQSN